MHAEQGPCCGQYKPLTVNGKFQSWPRVFAHPNVMLLTRHTVGGVTQGLNTTSGITSIPLLPS